jgi:hypothetical protein
MSGQDETRRDESQQPDDYDDDMNTDASFGDEADVPVPGSSAPAPSPRHTDLHPGDGLIDELPGNDGERPREAGQAPDETGMPDSDPGNAESDGAPNPR